MTAADMLAAAGESNTKEGRARFHKRFPSKEDFDNWYSQQNMARGGSPMVAVPVAFYQDGGATDGIAYPQQPTSQYMFEGASWYPSYKQLGGIAYPQQPTADVFFSGQGWTPKYADGGQYGGSPSPLGYGQMPPVMDFGGLTKKEKNNFVKQVVDGYVKAMGGTPSTRNKTFDTTQDFVQANKDEINRKLNNYFIAAAGKEVIGDAIENFDTLRQAGMAAYGQEMDWNSMRNPQAQENYNMYTNMYNQGMADTKAGFKTGMNAIGNYAKQVAQSVAANNAATMAYGGLPQAKFGDPIGPDPGNLFAKGKPFMGAPVSANNAGLNEAQILRKQIEEKYPINQGGNQGNMDVMNYLQQMMGQQGMRFIPNSFTFNPSYGDPFDYRGRNQYGKFRLRSYGPGIYNTQGANMFFPGFDQAGFQGGRLTPEQLKQFQAQLPGGMRMDYKQKNRILGLGPKSVEWSLRTGLPAEDAPLQVQLQDKKNETEKPGFFERRKQNKEAKAKAAEAEKQAAETAKKEDDAYYQDFLQRSRQSAIDSEAADNDIVIPGSPQRAPSNLGMPAPVAQGPRPQPIPLPRFPMAPGFEDVDMTPPASAFNRFSPNDRPAMGPSMSPMQGANALPAGTQSVPYTPSPVAPDNSLMEQAKGVYSPFAQIPEGQVYGPGVPAEFAYGGYSHPMMAMGGYNMYPFGGQSNSQYTYMTDEDIARFMAEGGTIEYVD
jgi:hypothetical protein